MPSAQASQCFTKYKYRGDAASGSGGPGIVATQVQQMAFPILVQQLELTTKPADVRARMAASQCLPVLSRPHQLSCPPCSIQVVSDYLTSFDDQAAYLKARNRPIVVYTYRMSFSRERPQSQGGEA